MGPPSYQIACTEGQCDHSVDCVRLAAHQHQQQKQQQQQLLRVLYAAWTGEIIHFEPDEAIKVHICTKHSPYGVKQHAHSEAPMAIKPAPQNLKRAVERFLIPEPTKLRPPCVSQCNPSIICHVDTSTKNKKEIPTNFIVALVSPPFPKLLFSFFINFVSNCAISRCRSALQSNVVRSLFVGRGEEVAVAVAIAFETECWWYFVRPPKSQSKKLRSDQLASASQNLFRPRLDHVRTK